MAADRTALVGRERHLGELKRLGFAGVQNFPTVGLIDGVFRQNLEETGMSYAKEVEMIGLAREIKDLISESVGQVEGGARLVDDAGPTMEQIVTSVRRVSELIAEIAAASEEQRSGIEQVNAAIGQMDQVVQKNAALVEQTGQSTEALHRHSGALLQSVAQFRLDRA